MKSVRLDPALQARLRLAAEASGVSESEFIRQAVDERAAATLAGNLEATLAGSIGAVRSQGGRAAAAHDRYGELLRGRSRKPASRR